MTAPPHWRASDFLSDLHLSPATPRTFEALARHLARTPADAVFLLGDVFEAWVGDDARHAGFEARCAEMLTQAARTRHLGFMHGNRDFLVGADLLQACGMQALDDPTLMLAFGQRALLTHGDMLCLADIDYQRFRAVVRSPAWRADFLARPLDERRREAARLRAQSKAHQAQHTPDRFFDIDPAAAAQWLRDADAPTLVHGHTHRPVSEALGADAVRHVLSDWDFEHAGAQRGDVLRWSRDGFTRVAPAQG